MLPVTHKSKVGGMQTKSFEYMLETCMDSNSTTCHERMKIIGW